MLKKLSAWLDHAMASRSLTRARNTSASEMRVRWLTLPQGIVRVYDSGGDKPSVVMTPDGPNVIEHYAALFPLLEQHFRVVCFDMPGFGFSTPASNYDHAIETGADAILDLMTQLSIERAVLAMSCANGFYAIRAARKAPLRVSHLLLSQTPSLVAMLRWTDRIIPAVLKMPILGQVVSRVWRLKMGLGWYRIALAKGTDATPYQTITRKAMQCGGCFSLAGVVQGLCREPSDANQLTQVPCTVLWGTADHSHKLTQANAVLLDVPHAQVVELPNCGHFPDLEASEFWLKTLHRLLPAAGANR